MAIDSATNVLMQSIENSVLTSFSKIIAIITDPLILLITSLIIAAILYLKKRNKQATLLATTTIATAILIKLSKQIIQRARPLNALVQEISSAFPSGHTTMAVVFFGLIAYLFITKKQKLAAIITTLIILLIAFTRIYLRVHWLTDVIAGVILGTIILAISITIHKKSNSF
ncbi:phosphatase PAP2 family protein [Candidatus Pacearchaeota archaeon]|nr:phosphatase PAP2 family protein [Candidatus Pacearchaeota archaeon]